MGELLICLSCMFLPVLAFGLVDQRQWPREEQNGEESPSCQSALACVKILEMTTTNNSSPAFGLNFFEDLEMGLRRLNSNPEGREVS